MHFPLSSCTNLPPTFSMMHLLQRLYGVDAPDSTYNCPSIKTIKHKTTRLWANAQRDGRPAEHRWRLLFNAAKFG